MGLNLVFRKLFNFATATVFTNKLYCEDLSTLCFHLLQAEAKCEVLVCFEKILVGLDSAASSGFKDIFKQCKACLGLKAYGVRCAAAKVSSPISF